MGNTGACTVCCTDLQKNAPFIQYVQDNPCFSEDMSSLLQSQGYTVHISEAQRAALIQSPGMASAPSNMTLPEAAAATAAAQASRSRSREAAMLLAMQPVQPEEQPAAPRLAPADGFDDDDAAHSGAVPSRALDSERDSVVSVAHGSAAPSESTAVSTTPDVGQAQHLVKNFVRTYVKGHDVNVLSVNGGTAACTAYLDRKLTTLSLQRAGKKDGKKRGIPLEDVAEICVGDEAGDDVELELDDFSVTLLLQDGQAVGFRLADLEERDTFALCMSMFVDGRRGEVQRKQKHKQKAGGA